MTRKIDDGAGRPEYYTSAQLARIIVWLSQYGPVSEMPEDVEDCIAWAAALLEKDSLEKDTVERNTEDATG